MERSGNKKSCLRVALLARIEFQKYILICQVVINTYEKKLDRECPSKTAKSVCILSTMYCEVLQHSQILITESDNAV